MTTTNDSVPLGDLMRRHGVRPQKGFGQNFLADPVHLERIVAAAHLTPDDTVLEVGPGVGTLTVRLARQAGRVVAVELDERLLPALREALAGYDNVTVVQGDILQIDPAQLVSSAPNPAEAPPPSGASSSSFITPRSSFIAPRSSFKVVANLPYYITSAAIRHLLETTPQPELIVLTIQREVAQRIVAKPPEMSLLAVSVQFYAQPEIVARIPAGAFYPVPKVDSAILRLTPWPSPPVEAPSKELFFEVVRAGFSQPRKQLRNSLKSGLALPAETALQMLRQAGIAAERRAETLSLEEWGRLVQEYTKSH